MPFIVSICRLLAVGLECGDCVAARCLSIRGL